MTKSGLIQAVAARLPHLPQRDLEIVVNTMFDTMVQALHFGNRVEIRGFGSFSVRQRRARQGRNPKTGSMVGVPAKRVPFFTVGHELKERVNGGRELRPENTAADAEVQAYASSQPAADSTLPDLP